MTAGATSTHAARLQRLDALAAEADIALEREVPLAPLTTLRVGGLADRLVLVRNRETLVQALQLARASGIPWFVLGNGSDLVVADAGIRGLVIRNRAREVSVEGETLRADAGAAMAMLVKRCISDRLAGLEFGISIPGTLGGAVWANAGAHQGEMRDVVSRVEVWDPERGGELTLDAEECAFSYRDSRFKHSAEVVVAASLQLAAGDPAQIARG